MRANGAKKHMRAGAIKIKISRLFSKLSLWILNYLTMFTTIKNSYTTKTKEIKTCVNAFSFCFIKIWKFFVKEWSLSFFVFISYNLITAHSPTQMLKFKSKRKAIFVIYISKCRLLIIHEKCKSKKFSHNDTLIILIFTRD